MALWTRPNVEDNDDDEFFGKDGDSDDDCGSLGLVDRSDGGSSMRHHHHGPTTRKGLAGHEAAAVEAHYQTLGYHETYESSQEATLQEGFVAGYTENFDTAFQIGAWLGRAAAAHRIYHDAAQEKECLPTTDPGDDDDDVFRKAVARIKTVLSETATQKSASGIVLPPNLEEGENDHDDDDDDTFEMSAKPRTDPLMDLQLELEALVLPYQLPER